MAVSIDTTRRILDALTQDRPTNRSTLRRRLDLDSDALDSALTDLAECGLVECPGGRVVSKVAPNTSAEAAVLLATLPADGSTKGNISLRAGLGFDEETYAAARQELLAAKLVRLGHGKGGTLARVHTQTDRTDGEAHAASREPSALSVAAIRILDKLPLDGATVGNIRLRTSLNMDEDSYARAKQELLDDHRVRPGIGRGGTLARVVVEPVPAKTRRRGLVVREKDLYEPFAIYLRRELDPEKEGEGDAGFSFGDAVVTATPKGYKRDGGRWSRPDVTQIRVLTHARLSHLPAETVVEISAFEIKPFAAAEKLESVYEAVAHGPLGTLC